MSETPSALTFACGVSELADTAEALTQVALQIRERIEGAADLVLAFLSPEHSEQVGQIHEQLEALLAPRVLMAVTAGGVIGQGAEHEQGPCLSVLAGKLPNVTLRPFSYEQIDLAAMVDSPEAMREAITQGCSEEAMRDLRGLLLIADPFSTPMVKLLPAMNDAFAGVPVIGGMASGGRGPRENRLLLNGRLHREGAIGLAIGGEIAVDCTVSQGCKPIGRPLVVTKAQRHVVKELGGRNAMEVVRELGQQLDGHDRELVEQGGLYVGRVINEYQSRFGRGDFLIRAIIGVDRGAGYLAVGDPQLRVGQTVQFHVRDKQTAEEDFAMLLQAQQAWGDAAGALLFNCNSRGTRLFGRPDADASLIRSALGDVPLAGFFAAGEFGPIGERSFVHAHTASLAVFRSAAGVPLEE